MVQMHPLSASTTPTGVAFEAEGGIRNPACQDDDSPEHKQQKPPPAQQRLHDGRIADKAAGQAHEHSPRIGPVMTVCRSRLPWRFSANLLIALVVSLIMLLGELGWIPSQKVGFYCHDPRISFKFSGDSVSTLTLLLVSTTLPAALMWAVECSYYSPDSYEGLECGPSSRSRQFWAWYGYYSLGWWYLIFVVEIVKAVVGEPRPHFLDSCRPRELANCSALEYRSAYTCTNSETSWFYVNDSDKSFPSGHAALSVFTGVFLLCYLQSRMPRRLELLLVKPWLQCLAVLWSLGCSLSRITDNRHHWWDVAAGGALGLVFSLFTVRVFCRRFEAAARDGPRHQSAKQLLPAAGGLELAEARGRPELPDGWVA